MVKLLKSVLWPYFLPDDIVEGEGSPAAGVGRSLGACRNVSIELVPHRNVLRSCFLPDDIVEGEGSPAAGVGRSMRLCRKDICQYGRF